MGLQAWNAFITGDYFYGIIQFPMWPAKSILTLGMALLGIRVITDILRNPLWSLGSFRSRIIGILTALIVLAAIVVILLIVNNLDISQSAAGWIVIGLFMITLFLGVPVGPATALTGMIGFRILPGTESAQGTAGTVQIIFF
jgi:hypothetical protein